MNVTETVDSTFNSTVNDSSQEITPNLTEVNSYIVFEALIALFAFINNAMVILALWKFRSLRTPTNYFVASLAVADIAVAVFAIPSAILLRLGLSISNHDCEFTTTPRVGEGVCLFIISSVIFLTQVSIFSLFIIAIDRFIAINYPFRYNVFMTSNKTRGGIIAAWLLGGLIGIAPQLGWNKWAGGEGCDHSRCAFEEVISMNYMVYFNFFGCVLTPLIAMGVMYMFIFRSAKTQLRKIYFDVRNTKKKAYSEPANIKKNTATSSDVIISYGNQNDMKLSPLSPSAYCEFGSESCYDLATQISVIDNFPVEINSLTAETQEMAGNSNSNCTPIAEEKAKIETTTNMTSQTNIINLNTKPSRPDNLGTTTAESNKNMKQVRQHLHKRSKSICNDQSKLGGEDDNRRMPRIKAHSFSAFSSITRQPNIQSKSFFCLKTTPTKKLTNRIPPSLQSSRSTIYTTEHDGRSVTESNTHRMRKKMKRKSILIKKEFRAARSLATVVIIFAMCWLPLHILNTITLFFPEVLQPPWLKDLAILLSHTNSLINPLIYAHKMRDFRTAFRKILAPLFPSLNSDETIHNPDINRPNCIKICCIKMSCGDVDEKIHSSDRTVSSDSWRENQTPENRNNNNINDSIVTIESIRENPKKSSKISWLLFKRRQRHLNQKPPQNSTKTTLLGDENKARCINPVSVSPNPENDDSRATYDEEFFIKHKFTNNDCKFSLIKSQETTL